MPEEIQEKHFLVLEDNDDDAYFLRRAFRALSHCSVFVCRTIPEAKAYVCGTGVYADRANYPRPTGVIADLRLGSQSGIDFVRWRRSTPDCRGLPVVILATEVIDAEREELRELGVQRFMLKPSGANELKEMIWRLRRTFALGRDFPPIKAKEFSGSRHSQKSERKRYIDPISRYA